MIEASTGIARETVTGANGRYSFPSLRPTTYEIRAELTWPGGLDGKFLGRSSGTLSVSAENGQLLNLQGFQVDRKKLVAIFR